MKATLGKNERLKSKKKMDLLFAGGKSFAYSPIRVIWYSSSEPLLFPAQVMFSVPKKSFKKATDRNRIKRMMREAYRLNKEILYEPLQKQGVYYLVAFLYTGKGICDWKKMQEILILSLQRLHTEANSSNS